MAFEHERTAAGHVRVRLSAFHPRVYQHFLAGLVRRVAVQRPFCHITVNIVEAPRVGLQFAHSVTGLKGDRIKHIVLVPSLGVQRAFIAFVAPGISGGGSFRAAYSHSFSVGSLQKCPVFGEPLAIFISRVMSHAMAGCVPVPIPKSIFTRFGRRRHFL